MTPEEYRRRRGRINAALRAAPAPLVRLLSPRPSREVWSAFVQAAYPAVHRARMDHWRLAEEWYRAERERQLARDEPIDFPRRNYPPEALDAALRERVRPRLDALEEDEPVPAVVVEEAEQVAERHATDGGREAIVDAARHDEQARGYARRATGASTCAFCLMLVSRGPVYKSASTALLRDGTGEPYHDSCDCIAVPVFDEGDWSGRAEFEEMQRLWREHGGDLATWRRFIASRDSEEAEGVAEAA